MDRYIIEYRKFRDKNGDLHTIALIFVEGETLWRYRCTSDDAVYAEYPQSGFKSFYDAIEFHGLERTTMVERWVRDVELGTIKYDVEGTIKGRNQWIHIHEEEFLSKEEMLL